MATREEELWAAIIAALNGEDIDVPVPAWRREEFLVGILGAIKGVDGATVPEPVWREEQYLKAMFDAISEGGGGGSYKLLASKEFTVSTSSSQESSVGTVTVDGGWTSDAIIYVKVRDKAGKRNGYFRGSDGFVINYYAANGTTSSPNATRLVTGVNSGGTFAQSTSSYGVYLSSYSKGTGDGVATATIKAKYSSSYGTINGTFLVEVYALSWPNDDSPFK